ncbi:MAG: stage III sporulation protein AE [Defluviitaleaceae bacterium]|nr:stage III sporulation protein AE [Defluviitaleaceae bacterium]
MNRGAINPDTADSANDILTAIQLDRYDTGLLDLPNMPRFIDLVGDALAGRLDLSPTGLLNAFVNVVFAEFIANGQFIQQLVVVAILSALISVLTEAFTHKSASETGFHVTFLMTAALAVSSFYIAVDVLGRLTATVNGIMQAAAPVMIGLMTMGGNFLGAAGFNTLLFFALQFLGWFVTGLFVPFVLAAAALDIASKLSDSGAKMDMLAQLTFKIASWSLKGVLALFAFLLTLQRMTAPIASNVALRTSRNIVGAVPVVGNAFTAAIDTVVGFSQAARSGVLVALVLVLCAAITGPLIKIAALSFIYKAVAAFLQPVADKRLSALMDSIGKHLGLLFSAAAFIGVLCIYTVVIVLSF